MNFETAVIIKGATSKNYPQNYTLVKMQAVTKDEVTARKNAAGVLGKVVRVGKHEGRVVESYLYEGPAWTVKREDGSDMTITPGDWLAGVVWNKSAGADNHARSQGEAIVMRKDTAMRKSETSFSDVLLPVEKQQDVKGPSVGDDGLGRPYSDDTFDKLVGWTWKPEDVTRKPNPQADAWLYSDDASIVDRKVEPGDDSLDVQPTYDFEQEPKTPYAGMRFLAPTARDVVSPASGFRPVFKASERLKQTGDVDGIFNVSFRNIVGA